MGPAPGTGTGSATAPDTDTDTDTDTGATSAPAAVPRAVVGRHLPALDGVRAVAVAGVIAYHFGLGWARGGYLGVDVFFVLSGFLITALLLEEWAGTGRIALPAFWGRRARRLLPALFVVVATVMVWAFVLDRANPATMSGPATTAALAKLRGDALATLFYVANWRPVTLENLSPLSHTWSLAVEEQFYIVWPLVVVALLRLRRTRWRRSGLVLCLGGALASALDLALRYTPADVVRLYSETDTRAFELLAGAALAMVAAARPQPGPRARRLLHGAAVPAGLGLLAMGATAGIHAAWMYRGGFVLAAALA
ncbi:MAG TPA: acyltransferase, partial [Acidimicrobiales bacterium]|nr:acyltransferase [Acidimicrobiales bacterium]